MCIHKYIYAHMILALLIFHDSQAHSRTLNLAIELLPGGRTGAGALISTKTSIPH